MKKLFVAALCCATSVPALAETGHIHSATCNHQYSEDQGALGRASARQLNTFVSDNVVGGGMKFVLNNLGGVEVGTDAYKGFIAATRLLSSRFKDDITIRLDVRFSQLGPNILGSTGSSTNSGSYALVKTLLQNDSKTKYDQKAVSNLQDGLALTFVTNEPPTPGTAIDARLRFLDSNATFDNLNVQLNTAQVKALGLTPAYNLTTNAGMRDGSVSFSNQFDWDFDRSNGLDPTKIDFVGVAAHEIGHALGFRSGVDLADQNSLPNGPFAPARGLGGIAWGTVHDLFRYGSFDGETVLDWSIGSPACHSITKGATCTGALSTARFNGDGRQASHWKDDAITGKTLGLMDPTASGPIPGIRPFQAITQADLIAFDAMGYDLNSVPEPATWAMMIGGFGLVGAAMRRRATKVSFA